MSDNSAILVEPKVDPESSAFGCSDLFYCPIPGTKTGKALCIGRKTLSHYAVGLQPDVCMFHESGSGSPWGRLTAINDFFFHAGLKDAAIALLSLVN